MRAKLLLIPIFVMLLIGSINAQSPERLAKKAQKFYQWEKYASAIPLFKKALEKKITSTWLYKLANSYRSINQTKEAETYYQQYLDTVKQVNPTAHYELAQVLISNGKYENAKEHLKIFIDLDPIHGTNADYLLENIDKIKNIPPYYPRAEVTAFVHNTEQDEHAAVFWNGNLVFTSDRKRCFVLLKKKSRSTNRDFLTMYYANASDTTFTEPKTFPRKINSLNKNVGYASFYEDGKRMIFSKNDIKSNERDEYPMQLFQAELVNGKWKNVTKLNFCNNRINYMHPAVTQDGKTLVFASKRGNGEGGLDLYISKFEGDKWTRPDNLGAVVNTSSHEGFPFFDSNNNLYFCSKGHLGFGGFDIYITRQNNEGIWKKPTNLGQPINSSQDDISFCIDHSTQKGVISSSRNGGDDDIFLFDLNPSVKTTPKIPIEITDTTILSFLKR